jgi:Probable zinc-ribbon domain
MLLSCLLMNRKDKPHRTSAKQPINVVSPRNPSPKLVPKIPRNAVRANIEAQYFGMGGPRVYYEDIERRCIDCKRSFVFSAHEQKYWYEVRRFWLDSTTIRCAPCRRKVRGDKGAHANLTLARQSLSATPNSPTALLELARAIGQLYQRTGEGPLREAIAAARAARRLGRRCGEAFYWEALCHHALGQHKQLLLVAQAAFAPSAAVCPSILRSAITAMTANVLTTHAATLAQANSPFRPTDDS